MIYGNMISGPNKDVTPKFDFCHINNLKLFAPKERLLDANVVDMIKFFKVSGMFY